MYIHIYYTTHSLRYDVEHVELNMRYMICKTEYMHELYYTIPCYII